MKKFMIGLVLGWVSFQVNAEELKWTTDLNAAKEQAKKEQKMVLMDFTGSDWCGWCIKLDKEVFATPAFAQYAKKNLVLVQLDFPRSKEQSAELKKANAQLKSKFGADGLPTVVVLNSNGKEVWKQKGYLEGGPKTFIAKLEEAKKK